MIFKAGHIVPRWCNVKTTDRKAQHNIKFGCDVNVTPMPDGRVRVEALTSGALIYLPRYASRKMRNKTIKKSKYYITDVIFIGNHNGSAITKYTDMGASAISYGHSWS